MASQVLTNVKTYLGEYDITGFTNAVSLDYAAAALKDTRMGHTTEVNKGGLKSVSFRIGGFADPGSAGMEAIAFGKIGMANVPITCSPLGGAVGDVAQFFEALTATMSTFGPHGALMPFTGTAVGGGGGVLAGGGPADRLVRGTVFVSSAVAKTSSGSSAIIQLGATSAAQSIFAAVHVIDPVAGTLPTLDITVKSAALVGFGSPTTRVTFTTATGATSEMRGAVGPYTDEFWRVDYAIGGSGGPSFPFIVVVGIV